MNVHARVIAGFLDVLVVLQPAGKIKTAAKRVASTFENNNADLVISVGIF